jgi:hypothetical protein
MTTLPTSNIPVDSAVQLNTPIPAQNSQNIQRMQSTTTNSSYTPLAQAAQLYPKIHEDVLPHDHSDHTTATSATQSSFEGKHEGDATQTTAPRRLVAIAVDSSRYSDYAFQWAVDNLIRPDSDEIVLLSKNVRRYTYHTQLEFAHCI